MSWKFVVSLVGALIVAAFAILNSEPVAINFLFKKAVISQALVILISVLVGALIVALLGSINRFKMSSAIKDEKHKVSELEKVIEGFNIPNPTPAHPAPATMTEATTMTEAATMTETMGNFEPNHE